MDPAGKPDRGTSQRCRAKSRTVGSLTSFRTPRLIKHDLQRPIAKPPRGDGAVRFIRGQESTDVVFDGFAAEAGPALRLRGFLSLYPPIHDVVRVFGPKHDKRI